jgi:hypothetical protein
VIARARSALSREPSHPNGAGGRDVARLMNRGNRRRDEQAIALLAQEVLRSSPRRWRDAGFSEAEVETPPGGKVHLIVATR